MDNQHRKIAGYRELTQEEIDLINKIKGIGNELGDLIDTLRDERLQFDQRWVSIAKTDLQKGVMGLIRAIAKPGGF